VGLSGETFPLDFVALSSTSTAELATVGSNAPFQVATNVTCAPNTPTGSNVTVAPKDPTTGTSPVTVTFSNVTQAGQTTVTSAATGNAPPAGFKVGNPPVFYEVATTASFSGQITICINYAGVSFSGQPQLFHYVNGTPVNVTTSVDTAHTMVCGTVTSLSPFALFESTNQPPIASAGANQTVEAAGPSGVAVTLSGSGSDPDNDPLTFTWSEGGTPLGSGAQIQITLPVGVHTITLTADDGRGGTGTSTVLVTVQDTMPPVLTLPANQTLEATGPTGAMAVFSASATDLVDGARPVVCSPASGSTFPLGTTTVNCTTTDTHGNSANGSFSVTVRDTTPPLVTPPVSITVPATEAGGARGSAWPAVAAFLAGASAKDIADPSPMQLSPQVGGANVDNTTLFPYGTTTVKFRFRDASNNIGSASASVTVILGTPKISAQVAGQDKLADGTLYVDVKLSNAGTGNARKLRVDLITALPTRGYGKIAVLSPIIPDSIGNLDAGSSETIRVIIKLPATVKQFMLGEVGNFANVKGVPNLFAQIQTVNP
jgi:hypothetical protein